MKDDFSWTKSIATLVFVIALLVGSLGYMFYTWSDIVILLVQG